MEALAGSVIRIDAILTCPDCGHQAVETMPVNACQRFYRCGGCQTTLAPLPGDCCVFCSYADSPCPPKQEELAASIDD